MKTCKELLRILNEETCWISFEVDDENLNEMSREGVLPKVNLEIHLEGSEGKIPHFHLQKKNGKKENTICHIKLLEAKYLRDKDDPMNTLSNKEKKALDTFMKSKFDEELDITNWEVILAKWNRFNPKNRVSIKNNVCPNYLNLSD